jgi:AraC-like DNA-binding protein
MQFKNITPIPALQNHIEKMWVFESSGEMPGNDINLVVPNGRLRLLIPFRNAIAAKIDGKLYLSKEHCITLTGIIDVPSKPELRANTGTIGIEFSSIGAYRFFPLKLNEVNNKIYPVTDILGKTGRQLEEQISNAETIEKKLILVQHFLLKQLFLQNEDSIFEYCAGQIKLSRGRITIKELEKKTGYSSRWLNMKFKDKLGISPKNISSIVRFSQYYKALANNNESVFFEKEFYEYYYDQSHFLKEFKRFTGLSHQGFQNLPNNFGKLFYKG